MEMQQVRYFLALSRTLNFTRAAEQCHVTQPALTRQIQQLEAELGGPLFRRERQNTHLTDLGQVMLPYLETIWEQTEAAKARSQALRRLQGASLSIGAMCTIGPSLLSDLVVAFRRDNPEVELQLADRKLQDLLEQLSEGRLDVAILASPEPLDPRFHAIPLFAERFMIAVAPGHPFAAKNAVSCQDLNDAAYVNRANCEFVDHIRKSFREIGVQTRRVFSSERDDWVQGMITAGLGFGLVPEFCQTDTRLVLRRLVDPEFTRTIQLVTVRGRPHAPTVGAFVSQARRFAWPQPAASDTDAHALERV